MKAWKKLLDQSGMGIAQAMVMVGILGTMTGIFIREADLINRQTGGLVLKARTDQSVVQIQNLLSNSTLWVYPGNPTGGIVASTTINSADNDTGALPAALITHLNNNLAIPGVTITGANYTVLAYCEGTIAQGVDGWRYETCDEGAGVILQPGESRVRLEFDITRGKGNQLTVGSVTRNIIVRGFLDGNPYNGIAGPLFPEDSEGYYAREFCNSIGGYMAQSSLCDNRFREKACLMMGGRWIEDNGAADQAACTLANGVWNLQFARCEQCAKQETLCAWLTDDPVTDGYQQCWDPINNKCSFPTIGAPTYNNMPWSDCGGANGATRTRIQRCIKGNCEGLCSGVIGTYPFDQIADTRSGGTCSGGSGCPGAYPGMGALPGPLPYNPTDQRDSTGPNWGYTTNSDDTAYPVGVSPLGPAGPSASSPPPVCQQYGRYNTTGGTLCDNTGAAKGLAGACYRDANCGNSFGFSAHTCNPGAWTTAANKFAVGQYRNQTSTTADVIMAQGCGPAGTWSNPNAQVKSCSDQATCTETTTITCSQGVCGGNCPNPVFAGWSCTAGGLTHGSNATCTRIFSDPASACRVDASIAAEVNNGCPASGCNREWTSTCNTAAQCGGTAPGGGWSPACTNVAEEGSAMSRLVADVSCGSVGSWVLSGAWTPAACDTTPGYAGNPALPQTGSSICSGATCGNGCNDTAQCTSAGCNSTINCPAIPPLITINEYTCSAGGWSDTGTCPGSTESNCTGDHPDGTIACCDSLGSGPSGGCLVTPTVTCYADLDGDGQGDSSDPGTVKTSCAANEVVGNNSDCCDSDAGVYVGAPYRTTQSACGGWDLDCNGSISGTTSSSYQWVILEANKGSERSGTACTESFTQYSPAEYYVASYTTVAAAAIAGDCGTRVYECRAKNTFYEKIGLLDCGANCNLCDTVNAPECWALTDKMSNTSFGHGQSELIQCK